MWLRIVTVQILISVESSKYSFRKLFVIGSILLFISEILWDFLLLVGYYDKESISSATDSICCWYHIYYHFRSFTFRFTSWLYMGPISENLCRKVMILDPYLLINFWKRSKLVDNSILLPFIRKNKLKWCRDFRNYFPFWLSSQFFWQIRNHLSWFKFL